MDGTAGLVGVTSICLTWRSCAGHSRSRAAFLPVPGLARTRLASWRTARCSFSGARAASAYSAGRAARTHSCPPRATSRASSTGPKRCTWTRARATRRVQSAVRCTSWAAGRTASCSSSASERRRSPRVRSSTGSRALCAPASALAAGRCRSRPADARTTRPFRDATPYWSSVARRSTDALAARCLTRFCWTLGTRSRPTGSMWAAQWSHALAPSASTTTSVSYFTAAWTKPTESQAKSPNLHSHVK